MLVVVARQAEMYSHFSRYLVIRLSFALSMDTSSKASSTKNTSSTGVPRWKPSGVHAIVLEWPLCCNQSGTWHDRHYQAESYSWCLGRTCSLLRLGSKPPRRDSRLADDLVAAVLCRPEEALAERFESRRGMWLVTRSWCARRCLVLRRGIMLAFQLTKRLVFND